MKLTKPKFTSGDYVKIVGSISWTHRESKFNGQIGKIDCQDWQADVISHEPIYAVQINDDCIIWCREEWLETVPRLNCDHGGR